MLQIFLASLLLTAGAATSGPGGQAEPPYNVLVCLRFDEDPLFTRLFTNRIERQVRDQLTNYFGPLAKIEVTSSHPLLEAIGDADLRDFKLSPEALAAHQLPDKVFVVGIGNEHGTYKVQWRQLDSDTQQIGPWHWRVTPDRQWVGKAVCLAVTDDFAPVAIVKPITPASGVDTRQVELEFRGAAHPELLARWLGQNCLLQPYWIIKQKDGSLVRKPIPNTVLRMGKNDGPRKATVISNQANPWKPTARLVGFQALKLNTQAGRLRLRLVDAVTGDPVRAQVYANTVGFGSIDNEHQLPLPDREGYVVSREPIEHLAFVRISQGGSSFVQFPLVITGEWTEMTCKVPRDRAAGEKSEWERQLRYLVQDVNALQAALNDNVRVTNQMHEDKKYEEALRALKTALASISENRAAAGRSQVELAAKATELKIQGNTLLAWVDTQLTEIDEQEKALAKKSTDLDNLIQKMDAQSRAQVLIGVADEAMAAGNIEEAIEKFQLALNEQPDQPMLKARLDKLQETWRIKSPEHERARAFVFDRWPATEVTEIEARLPEAEKALASLEQVGDTLTAQRFSSVNNDHVIALSDLLDQLADSGTEEDLKEAEKYSAVLEKIAQLQDRIGEFIVSGASAAPRPEAATAPAEPAAEASPPAGSKRPPVEEEEEVPPK